MWLGRGFKLSKELAQKCQLYEMDEGVTGAVLVALGIKLLIEEPL